MVNEVILVSCSVIACFISIVTLVLSTIAIGKVYALEKSTHSVQFVPIDERWAQSDKEVAELNESMADNFDDQLMGL